jgi:hypothetical protein
MPLSFRDQLTGTSTACPRTRNRASGPRNIINAQLDPVAVPEIELGRVPPKVRFADMEIAAVNPAFQNRKVPLDGVGMRVAPEVLADGMVHGPGAASEVPADIPIGGSFVTHVAGVGRRMTRDDRTQGRGGDVRNVEGPHAAGAFWPASCPAPPLPRS